MTYTATITATTLRLRESRIVADLLLQDTTKSDWDDLISNQNKLQMGSPESAKRTASILRARLEPLGQGLWKLVRDGAKPLATQAAFAGAVKHSRVLGDFMDISIREQKALFSKQLGHPVWNDFIAGCRGRDPEMPHWTDQTLAKLRSSVFCMLAEAGYLESTKSLRLQNVFVDTELADLLRKQNESYVLRCLEVAE